MIRAHSPSGNAPTPVPNAGSASERQPSSSATSRARARRSAHEVGVRPQVLSHDRAVDDPACAEPSGSRRRRRVPSGIPPIAMRFRARSRSPPARLSASRDAGSHPRRSLAAVRNRVRLDSGDVSFADSSAARGSGRRARRHELDGELAGRVLAVEDRVDLDDVHRVDASRTRRRSPSRGAPRGTRARRAPAFPPRARTSGSTTSMSSETWRNAAPAACASASRRHGSTPDPVDLAHREDLRVELRQELPLAVVERANADERELARVDRRQRPAVARERVARPSRARRRAPSRGRCRSATSPAC